MRYCYQVEGDWNFLPWADKVLGEIFNSVALALFPLANEGGMYHAWKIASTLEDTISMLRIQFLPAVDFGAGCVSKKFT